MLRPVVGLARDFHVAAVILPRADGGEKTRLGRSHPGVPLVEVHRWPGPMPVQTGWREKALGLSDIVAISKKQLVRLHEANRGRNLARDFELHNAGIGFEVN